MKKTAYDRQKAEGKGLKAKGNGLTLGAAKVTVLAAVAACVLALHGCTDDSEATPGTQTFTPLQLTATADEGSIVTRGVEAAHNGQEQKLAVDAPLYLRIEGNWPQKSEYPIVWTGDVRAGNPDYTGAANYINWGNPSTNPGWEYFGTSDPLNTVGILDGLTILATGIGDFVTAAPHPVEGDWNTFEWALPTSGTWKKMQKTDLLYANNIASTPGEGTYKYADHVNPRLIRMRHAMSRVTLYIKAGEGFTDHVFEHDPEVYLTSNRVGEHADEYAYTKGRVNIPAGLVTPDDGSQRVITMANVLETGGHDDDKIYTYKAFIFPGSHLWRPSDNDIQVKIVVDGATYYVKAEKMNAKMMDNSASPYHNSPVTKQGHNYLWTVTINRQKIDVEASVLKWNEVIAEEDVIVVH